MRQVWSLLLRLPQALLVQSDQLPFDSAYILALLPPVIFSVLFFRSQALLLYGLCLLTGVVCLLSIQLARLTAGLPAWVGYKASHPLISSLLVACFLSPLSPPWLGVGLVILLVVLDTVAWPQLRRMLTHPALLVLAFLYLAERQLQISFVNPFDLRPLGDPLNLWFSNHVVIDPIKMYVGNVPGPMGATSMGAVLLGVAYLWYTRKISLTLLLSYYAGMAATALAYNFDVAFQLSSGPALYVVGFLAADRRRMVLSDRLTALIGLAAGCGTVVLRALGQGPDAAWQSLLAVTLVATLAYWLATGVGFRRPAIGRPRPVRALRALAVSSSQRKVVSPAPLTPASPARPPLSSTPRQPVLAGSSAMLSATRRPQPARGYQYDVSAQDDIVRQMRIQAARRAPTPGVSRALQGAALILVNPVGLWLTWKNRYDPTWLKWAISIASSLWYFSIGAVAALLSAHIIKL